MFQEQLPYDKGMIFVFDEPGFHSLWMLNMQFPLDMIWFDSDGKVAYIEKNVPPNPIIEPSIPAMNPKGINQSSSIIMNLKTKHFSLYGVFH